MNRSAKLKILRYLAVMEGISYLLFAITMPLKYIYGLIGPNYVVGMAHGLLFVAYCLFVLLVAKAFDWKFKKTFICLAASLLPIATFIVDARILRHEKLQ